MSAIENGNREEVQHADGCRQQRDEPDEAEPALAGRLPRHLGDADGAGKVAGRDLARDHMIEPGKRRADDEDDLVGAVSKRLSDRRRFAGRFKDQAAGHPDQPTGFESAIGQTLLDYLFSELKHLRK